MRTAFKRQTKAFALVHDDVPAFHATFLVLTFLAAALFNVGAFAVLVAVHMGLDLIKYHEIHHDSWTLTLAKTMRESVLDLFLLTLALCSSIYLHHGGVAVALSGAFRIEETILRVLLVVLPRLEVLRHGLTVFGNIRTHFLRVRTPAGPWRMSEKLCLSGIVATIVLIIIAPLMLDPAGVLHILREEMIPWRV